MTGIEIYAALATATAGICFWRVLVERQNARNHDGASEILGKQCANLDAELRAHRRNAEEGRDLIAKHKARADKAEAELAVFQAARAKRIANLKQFKGRAA